MAAMKSLVTARKANAAGVDPAAFDTWIAERDGMAKQTVVRCVPAFSLLFSLLARLGSTRGPPSSSPFSTA